MRGGLRRLRKLQIDSAVGVVYNHVICPIMYQCRTSKAPDSTGVLHSWHGQTRENLGISDGVSRDSVVTTVAAIFL
jgi:hypothetical protein